MESNDDTRRKITVKSWNRFITTNLCITPDLLGFEHEFLFENANVKIKIPKKEEIDRGEKYDLVASVGGRRAIDNEPIEIDIHKVNVEVSIPSRITVPSEILNRPCNAYDLLSKEEQDRINKVAEQHKVIAEKAFMYWLRIIRWVCDSSNIGRSVVKDFRSSWSTHLLDIQSEKPLWAESVVFHIKGYKVLNHKEWEDARLKLLHNEQPPIYLEQSHDAEEYIRLGDYRLSIIGMAIACETFIRYSVLNKIPKGLSSKIVTYIEEANINQYINHFFPELLDDEGKQKYKAIHSNLHKLIDQRNKLLHMGRVDGVTEENCLKFLEITKVLFLLII